MCSENPGVQAPPRPFPGPALADPLETGKHTQIQASHSLQQGLPGRRESHPYTYSHQASDNTLVKPEVRACLEKNERGIHPIVTGVRDGTGAEQPVLRAKV